MTAVPCAARSKSTGEPCGRFVTPPATVCYSHGGAAGQVRRAVERKRQEEALEKAVQTYGAPIDIPADEAMAAMIADAYGHFRWLADIIASSPDLESVPPLVWTRIDVERALLARLNRDSLSLGLEERKVRIEEEQGRAIANVLRDVIADLFRLLLAEGLPGDVLVRVQRERVPALVRTRLLEVMSAE